MLLQRAQAPDSPTTLLMMLARAQMPEKYGPARRGGPPRGNGGCDHHCHRDSQPTATSQYDKDFLDDVRRDLQNLKQLFAGLSEPDLTPVQPGPNPSPQEHETPTHSDLSPADPASVGAGFKPAHDLSAGNEDSDLTPADPASVGAGFKPAHDPTPSTETLSPVLGESLPRTRYGGWGEGNAPAARNLTRSQRRQLQRKQRKHQSSRLARAPT